MRVAFLLPVCSIMQYLLSVYEDQKYFLKSCNILKSATTRLLVACICKNIFKYSSCNISVTARLMFYKYNMNTSCKMHH